MVFDLPSSEDGTFRLTHDKARAESDGKSWYNVGLVTEQITTPIRRLPIKTLADR
jgi:hypothetical protein